MTVMRQVSFIGGKLHRGMERDGASFASSAAKSLPRKYPNDAVVFGCHFLQGTYKEYCLPLEVLK